MNQERTRLWRALARELDQWAQLRALERECRRFGDLVNDGKMKKTDAVDLALEGALNHQLWTSDYERGELERKIGEWIEAGTPKKRQPALNRRERRLVFKRLLDIEPQPVRWLWPDRIPRKFVLFTGLPDTGKTLTALDLAARISRGEQWPDGSGAAPLGRAIILTAEDGLADTIRTRAQAARADLGRIICLERTLTEDGKPGTFSLQDDLMQLADEASKWGDISLIIIDPITAYLGAGKIDSHRTSDVRAVLGPIAEFADEQNVAVIGITHPPKAAGPAINAATGSLAFIAAARAAYLFIAEPGTDRTLMLPIKSNLGPKKSGLAYRIEQHLMQVAGGDVFLPRLRWDSAPVSITANEAITEAAGGAKQRGALEEAVDFLRDALGAGARDARDVMAEANANGVASRTLKRAKQGLNVQVKKKDFADGWLWCLPEGGQETAKGAKADSWPPSSETGPLRGTTPSSHLSASSPSTS